MTPLLLLLACTPDELPAPDQEPPVEQDSAAEHAADSGADSGLPSDDSMRDSGQACDDCPWSSVSAAHPLGAEDLTSDPSRTRDNPLKGFMTSYLWSSPANELADQMEFMYIPMKDLWSEEGETLESGLEPLLEAAASRSHHAVIRVYIDYPGKESGLPDYLQELVSCEYHDHFGAGCSPDYEDPDLYEAMMGLIQALGARYDGDPRLGFVQAGLLGFWGEWHTYPYDEWFPSEETQSAILSAYTEAFSVTQLLVRYPIANSLELRMGFHDDSFAYSTLGEESWFFLPLLEGAGAAERWQEVPIGGELRPELQSSVFSDDYELGAYAQDVGECVEEVHATYLLNYHAYSGDGVGYQGEELARAEEAALQMGYQFALSEATLHLEGLRADSVSARLELTLLQEGVAPFYYPLSLEVSSPLLEESWRESSDLSALLPGQSQTLSLDLGEVPLRVLEQPLTLELVSEILQDSQRVLLATETPWSQAGGLTALQWELVCEDAGERYALGEVSGQSAEGCDCRCDVDGVIRSCDGASCAP